MSSTSPVNLTLIQAYGGLKVDVLPSNKCAPGFFPYADVMLCPQKAIYTKWYICHLITDTTECLRALIIDPPRPKQNTRPPLNSYRYNLLDVIVTPD